MGLLQAQTGCKDFIEEPNRNSLKVIQAIVRQLLTSSAPDKIFSLTGAGNLWLISQSFDGLDFVSPDLGVAGFFGDVRKHRLRRRIRTIN